MKIAFFTLGCKVNQYETQAMRRQCEQKGYCTVQAEYEDLASYDAIVVNSCTVTGESDRKLRQLLRRCRRDNPQGVLVLTGCMPQAFPDKAGGFDEVDIVLGNGERSALTTHLEAFWQHRQRIVSIPPHGKTVEPLAIDTFEGRTRAFVKIQDGCNRFCTYCIIPYARGRVRSRSLADIRAEVEELAKNGYREVVLVGINLTAFGQDTGGDIADAVEVCCSVEGIERVRLGSLEPDYMTPAVLDRLAKQRKLCPQFHVALQSGCNATLKRMNRHYTAEEFASLCEDLRRRFPHCALTTDVMVGFPGETEEEFEESLRFVRKCRFSRVHTFAYSRRPGTPADKMPNQVSNEEKNNRSRHMIEACRQDARLYAESYVGQTTEVLLETPHKDGRVEGHTVTYLTVMTKTTHTAGELIQVRITHCEGDCLYGEEIKQ